METKVKKADTGVINIAFAWGAPMNCIMQMTEVETRLLKAQIEAVLVEKGNTQDE